jgi:hypothetical protein
MEYTISGNYVMHVPGPDASLGTGKFALILSARDGVSR